MIETILQYLALWLIGAVLLGATWAGFRGNSRAREEELELAMSRMTITADDRRPLKPGYIYAVVVCRLCGPTIAEIQACGHCWRCRPVVQVVREAYAARSVS